MKAKQHFFKSLNLNALLEPATDAEGAFTGTKLVCSLGPSSHSVQVLEEMLNAGMAAARIDLTWGGLDFHRKTLHALQEAMTRTRKLCAVVLSTLGREVMVRRPCVYGEDGWPAHPSPFSIEAGQRIMLTTREDVEATDRLLPVTYPHLHNMCQAGDTIYIGRYLVTGSDSASLYLKVLSVEGQDIQCEAQNGAVMDGLMTVFHMERSSDSLLNLQNNLPLLSDYDMEAIAALGTEFEVDFINLAYTRTREDVREARQFLDSIGLHNCRVLAKVETRQALLNFRGILAAADGVVISRGNIGLDVAPEKMALVQKQLISNCNLMGKPVLITRVVDSMVTNPRPTRAEATDIANAVLDGVDGILLGAETLRGEYPVDCVATIAQICRVAEGVFDYSTHYDALMAAAQDMANVMRSTAQAAAAQSGPHQLQHANATGKSVAFAPGTSPGDEDGTVMGADMASEPASPSSSYAEVQAAALMGSSSSFGNLQAAYEEVNAFTKYGGAGSLVSMAHAKSGGGSVYNVAGGSGGALPFLSKLESLASSAVRSAGNTKADLIIVYTATGRTAQLVAKYRPPMPILTLVVPRLVNDGIRWRLEGRSTARACQLTRGLLPMLATPGPNGDAVLESAVVAAARAGLVAPRRHVVVLQQIHEDFCVKVLSLDATGTRVAGSTVRSRAFAADASRLSGRASSSGALVDSGGEEEDDEEEDEEDDFEDDVAGSYGLLAASAGKLARPSAAMLGKPAAAVAVPGQKVRKGAGGKPAAVAIGAGSAHAPAAGTPKPASPDTPVRLGSAGDQKRGCVTLAST